jgi:plastocyanin
MKQTFWARMHGGKRYITLMKTRGIHLAVQASKTKPPRRIMNCHLFENRKPNAVRGAKSVLIKGWQRHFWKKPVINVAKHPRLESPLNCLQRTNTIQKSTNPNGRSRMVRWALRGLAICVFSGSLAAFGATANINIVNFAFSPNTVNINVNDSVTWTWVGSPHSATSDTTLWDSGVFGAGHTFSRTFTSAGSFPFHCTVHPFMTGTITVQSINVPPAVTLTNPPNGSVFAAPASFVLAAAASDSDGRVARVEFLQGTNLLGSVKASPYSMSVSNVGAGTYVFSAIAVDDGGSKATNALTISVVTAAPIRLSAPQRLSPTSFQFSYTATVGLRYVIQRSSDLTHWTDLETNTATANSIVFQDAAVRANPTFYRVGLLNNP